jgi:2-oxo-4-hydroxy-4-carboxy-5-ureidoimidazoline decarboxylase
MTLAELNAGTKERFVEAVGGVFEASPWVAERAWRKRPFSSFDDLSTRLIQEVQTASPNEQLALLYAYPDSEPQYRKKFGFPFVFATQGSDEAARAEALQRRLKSPAEQEFQVALGHVFRIARFRLEEVVR